MLVQFKEEHSNHPRCARMEEAGCFLLMVGVQRAQIITSGVGVGGLGARGLRWVLTGRLSRLLWVQAFLRFRPQEYDLDIPGGPVVQYCSLMRELQLQAFPQFVSGASPFPFLGETGDRGR